jgi:hypothetical protein
MRTIRRTMIASALALPLTIGAAGVASADSFSEHGTYVGPEGAHSQSVSTYAGEQGGTSFEQQSSSVTAEGAWTEQVSTGTSVDGETTFEQSSSGAGEDGAYSDSTSASAGGNVDAEYDNDGVLGGLLGSIGL